MSRSIFSTLFGRAARLAMAGVTVLALLTLSPAPVAALVPGATILVNSTADVANGTDNACTLREAIIAANTNTPSGNLGSYPNECAAGTTGLDTITFDSAGTFSTDQTIVISDGTNQIPLPSITAPVIIDGNIGSAVTIQGWGAGTGDGFTFDTGSAGSKLNEMVIVNWGDAGVMLKGTSGKVTLTDNLIGVQADGSTAEGNNYGIWIQSSYNVVGGLDSGGVPNRNLISANAQDGIYVAHGSSNLIQGNRIGTTEDGLSALGNSLAGVNVGSLAVNTLIGGMKANQGNILSGNKYGIQIDSGALSTKIQRNFIGTNATGLLAIPNSFYGIYDQGGISTVIGGTMPQGSNLIAGNNSGGAGILFDSSGTGSITITGNLMGVTTTNASLPNLGNVYSFGPFAKVIITNNLLANTQGINVYHTPASFTATQNCILNPSDGAASNSSIPVTLKSNWWGDPSGPNPPGSGSALTGTATFIVAPWLTKPPVSCLGWAPKTISPVDQSFKNKSTAVTKFSWGAVGTANDYHFTLSQNANLSSPIDNNLDLGLLTYHNDGPLDYGTYYWQTTTGTADGFAWPSPIHTFYVTTMSAPKPGTSASMTKPIKFAWAAYPGATSYTWTDYNDSSCTSVHNQDTSLITTYKYVTFGGSGPEYWNIKPNNGPTMPCWNFTITP